MNMNTTPEDQAYCDAMAIEASADAMIRIEQDRLVAEAAADGRKLVTVRTISAIDDIPGADLIKVAQVEGWKVVVRAGEFQPGDLCVFFEVDCYLPMCDDRYSFLEKNAIFWHGIHGARLKTIRLRKQLSQGLALPVSIYPELKEAIDNLDPITGMTMIDGLNSEVLLRDINFSGVLGIMKWEKVLSAGQMANTKGNFPSFLQKSDQERCVSGDTLISTENGQMAMEVLCSLDGKPKVWSYNHTNQTNELKCIKGFSIMRRGGEWLKITTATGKSMVVTSNHRVWCEDLQAYRLASELTVDQSILTQN